MSRKDKAMSALNSGCFGGDSEEDKLVVKKAKDVLRQELKSISLEDTEYGYGVALEVLTSGVLLKDDVDMIILAKEIVSKGLD